MSAYADVPIALTNGCFGGKNGHDANGPFMSASDPKRTSMSQHQATPAQRRLAGKATDPVVNGG